MSLLFQWAAESISGTRKSTNDDSFIIFSSGVDGSTQLPDNFESLFLEKDFIFAVSDGMGGGNAGNLASKLILETLSDLMPRVFKLAAQGFHPNYLELLEEKIILIHEAINKKEASTPNYKGMGATLILAWFTPENLYVAHVGDSRLYLHRDEKTKQLTHDHNFTWNKLDRQEINERQYRSDPCKSILYEVMGAGHQKISPEIFAIPYQAGDKFMLCSDGIIDGLWEKNIHSIFKKDSNSTKEIKNAFITRAIDNDGSDDTTLICIEVKNSK